MSNLVARFSVLLTIFLLVGMPVAFAVPNPGHRAQNISGGTFSDDDGDFVFPATTDVDALGQLGAGTTHDDTRGVNALGTAYGIYGSGATAGVYGADTVQSGVGQLGIGDTGVYGSGTNVGVNGSSTTLGVTGIDTDSGGFGHLGFGTTGVYASGGFYGTYSTASNTAVYGTATAYGVFGSAVVLGVNGTGGNGGVEGSSSADTGIGRLGFGDTGVQGLGSSYGVYSVNDLRFDDEIMPDGATCANDQILKRTAADDWDCVTDETDDSCSGADEVEVAGVCVTVPDCDGTDDVLNYDITTDSWSCGVDCGDSGACTTIYMSTDTSFTRTSSSLISTGADDDLAVLGGSITLAGDVFIADSGSDLLLDPNNAGQSDVIIGLNGDSDDLRVIDGGICAASDGACTAPSDGDLSLEGGDITLAGDVLLSDSGSSLLLDPNTGGQSDVIIGVNGDSDDLRIIDGGICATGDGACTAPSDGDLALEGGDITLAGDVLIADSSSDLLLDPNTAGQSDVIIGVNGDSDDLRVIDGGICAAADGSCSVTGDGDLYAEGDIRFDGEIQPDGSTCSDGEILKRTAANDWDCVIDGGGCLGADEVWVAGSCVTIPDCDATASVLNYDITTDSWSCGVDCGDSGACTTVYAGSTVTMANSGNDMILDANTAGQSDVIVGINGDSDDLLVIDGGICAASDGACTAPSDGDLSLEGGDITLAGDVLIADSSSDLLLDPNTAGQSDVIIGVNGDSDDLILIDGGFCLTGDGACTAPSDGDIHVEGGNVGVGAAPDANTAVYATGVATGVYGSGTGTGVYGTGTVGVYATGTDEAVYTLNAGTGVFIDNPSDYGIFIEDSPTIGMTIEGAGTIGVQIQTSPTTGVQVQGSDDYGGYFVENGGAGTSTGVYASSTGIGMYATGSTYALHGQSDGTRAIYGENTEAVSGTAVGVAGFANGAACSPCYGVEGQANGNANGQGVRGTATGGGVGVYGQATGTTGVYGTSTTGVYGDGTSYSLYGAAAITSIYGNADGTVGSAGVHGQGSVSSLAGVSGTNTNALSGYGGTFSGYTGVYGDGTAYSMYAAAATTGIWVDSPTSYGMYVDDTPITGIYVEGATSTGIYAVSSSTRGIYGLSSANIGRGVTGEGTGLNAAGVSGIGSGTGGIGVLASGVTGIWPSGTTYDIYASGGGGTSIYIHSPTSYGIYVESGGVSDPNTGLYVEDAAVHGVYAVSDGTGVYGSGATGVYGTGSTYGVNGYTASGNRAIYGNNAKTSGTAVGVAGFANGGGSGARYGVEGQANGHTSGQGVRGTATTGTGVYGSGGDYGVYGAGGSYGVRSAGTLYANGNCYDGNTASCSLNDIAEEWHSEKSYDAWICPDNSNLEAGEVPEDCYLPDDFDLEFEDGDVICAKEGLKNILRPCEEAYEKTAISVITEYPTVILGGVGPYNVALAGNIPVKVICDEPIEVGDSLVYSGIDNYAMKLTIGKEDTIQTYHDKQQGVFAKALEECGSGKKIIRGWI